MSPLPLNAKPILDARLRGFKPAEMVIVSLVGHVESQNHIVRAVSAAPYDWRWVADLDVCLYVGDLVDCRQTLKAIALHRPAYLCVWNCFEHWGAHVYLIPTADDVTKPVRQWTYELDYLEWLDFQNDDFIEGRTYKRNAQGIPYASHTRHA